MAAIASTEAKEKTVRTELAETLPGASSGLSAKRTIVAGHMARNGRWLGLAKAKRIILGPPSPKRQLADYARMICRGVPQQQVT
jgi:hypothetical protein